MDSYSDDFVDSAMNSFWHGDAEPFICLLSDLPRNDHGWRVVKKIVSQLAGLVFGLKVRLSRYESVD